MKHKKKKRSGGEGGRGGDNTVGNTFILIINKKKRSKSKSGSHSLSLQMRGRCRQMYHSCRLVNKRRFGSILLFEWSHYWRSVHSPTGIKHLYT